MPAAVSATSARRPASCCSGGSNSGGRRAAHSARPSLPFAGGVTGFVGDITDARPRGSAANERRALCAGLAGANDGIWDGTLQHDVMYLSQRWQTMLGLAPEAMPAAPRTVRRVHADDIRPTQGRHCRALRSPVRPFRDHEPASGHGDGATAGCAVPRRSAGDRPRWRAVRMAGSADDVTELIS